MNTFLSKYFIQHKLINYLTSIVHSEILQNLHVEKKTTQNQKQNLKISNSGYFMWQINLLNLKRRLRSICNVNEENI